MKILLKPLELLYRGVSAVRRKFYRSGVWRQRRLPRPVISVGNISFGGSGKTPVVIAVARELVRNDVRVVILTRGFGRRGRGGVVGGGDAATFGDEPVVIARAVPQATVLVDADRYRAATEFLREHDAEVFLLDDGFQHLQLARDLDIVIVAPHSRWLREGRSALRDADLLLVRDGPGEFRLTLEPTALVSANGELPLETLRGAKVLAFSGLADNRQFFATCERLGASLVETRSFPDHHRYTTREVDNLIENARAAGAMLLTTEKDAVKIGSSEVNFLRVEAVIQPAAKFFGPILRLVGR